MKNKLLAVASIFIMLATLLAMFPACKPITAASSYLAVVPNIIYSGSSQAISLSLFKGDVLVRDEVEVTLFKDGQTVTKTEQVINGSGTVTLNIPDIADGKYELQVKGGAFSDRTTIQIKESHIVFVETDKPIYKPGQTIHIRVMTLDSELKPKSLSANIEVLDGKGIKIYRSTVQTDEYGMARADLPISNEPNLGTWKINVATDKAKNQLDIQVEEYVLPKYEVTVNLPKEWFLVSEPITGEITSTYSFGKPVVGTMTITATKYVGEWQEYATVTKDIDGNAEFEIPAAQYVAGTPAAGGQGNIQLDVTVTEKSTGYVEKTSRLLTVAPSSVNLELIPESSVFKPGLPFSVLFISETPDNKPVDLKINATVTYSNSRFDVIRTDEQTLQTVKGKAIMEITPPESAIAMSIDAFELTPVSSVQPAQASKVLQASYSPSGNFIHLEQTSEGTPKVGQRITFSVNSTNQAVNFYYEVIARGRVVYSDYTKNKEIPIITTPLMAPTAKLLVYQILPNSEVAADYLPFNVEAVYPQEVEAGFSTTTAEPGEKVQLNITTEGKAKVGIAVVDKSVFILAENRMNLQQVFDELERLYMEPQAEIHDVSFYPVTTTIGAADVFKNAGVTVMTNKNVPSSKDYEVKADGNFLDKIFRFFGVEDNIMFVGRGKAENVMENTLAPQATTLPSNGELAEIQRVRQFFPETWLWDDVLTNAGGKYTLNVNVPDSITTWMLRAVAISKDKGLGVAENSLTVFQPFFLTIDLPYSAIRGEEFPVKVAVYNYLDTTQTVRVEIEQSGWYELLDYPTKTITIGANDIGGTEFTIRPAEIGINEIKISARSSEAADAVIKTIIIEPEGVAREIVDNLTLKPGVTATIDTSIPQIVVSDSGRAYIAVTSSFLTQTIDGLDALLQMPFGCGEQNMIVFAPDVYITKYLRDSGQLKPEILAKAELLMVTGYQRELTYRHTDGSFSAFGMDDESGSLWLTAFVLKCFSQAKDLIYIDDGVLNSAVNWLTSHQNSNGSFDQVGFVHHQEMLGGLQGKDALTAYTAIALMEAGETAGADRAVAYLETKISGMTDPYAVAITTYALEMANSPKASEAYNKLMSLAKEDENGLHWGSDIIEPGSITNNERMMPPFRPDVNRSGGIETTAYATLALVKYGDAFNASRASKWLVAQRNAYGGYGSTQDTVVTLQALTEYAANTRSEVDLLVTLKGSGVDKQLKIDQTNFDVLQIVDVPVNAQIDMTVSGRGDAIGQVVRRFNEPAADTEPAAQMLKIDVNYDTTEVAVNDLINVSVHIAFNPLPEFNISEAGMIVVDISIPTGFEAVTDSVAAIANGMPNIKRYDIAGRKVIFYVENMKPGENISFGFQVKAIYPVKAKGVTSTAYSYYKPDIKGEVLSEAVTVE